MVAAQKSNLDAILNELVPLARGESDKELKLAIVDRIIKIEALKVKAQQGAMGAGFEDEPE